MKKTPLIFPFVLALTAALFNTALFPSAKLFAFAPFLAIAYMSKPISTALWLAAISGSVIDLMTSELRFGTYALNYCLTTLLLYHQKRHFFDEKPLALALFTALISCISSTLQVMFLIFSDHRLPLSLEFFLTDLLALPFLDALYAFLWFTLPIKAYAHIQRHGWKGILAKKIEEE